MGLLGNMDRLIDRNQDFVMAVTQKYLKGVQSVEDYIEKSVDTGNQLK